MVKAGHGPARDRDERQFLFQHYRGIVQDDLQREGFKGGLVLGGDKARAGSGQMLVATHLK